MIDLQGMIQFVNKKGAALLNLEADQQHISIFKLVPGMESLLFFEEKESISEVHIGDRKVIFNHSPLYSKGELCGISALFEEEKYYEGLLKELDSYKNLNLDLKAIFDTSYDVIYVSDHQGVTLRVSSACKELWGKEEKELVGKSVYELEEAGIYKPSVTRLVLEKKETVSLIQTTKTGRRLKVVGTPIKDENGEIIRVVNASRDITEVSRLQSELNEMKQLIEGYKKELNDLRSRTETETQLVYRSKEMNQVISLAQRVADVDSTVLILGETGVGKEVIANYIHKSSPRSEKPFITINCGAIPENLLESELFGYEKGAFTGAVKQKLGLFELASEGTLFLDEIGEMPLPLQTKLLRVIQEQQLVRVGGTKPIAINIRLITATNRNLLEEVKKGAFREDLYYRLNVIPIKIPALRYRKDDVLPLILHFVEVFNQKYMRTAKISNSALDVLQEYEWPGNVRELQNIIERLVVLTEKEMISQSELEGLFYPSGRRESKSVVVNNIIPLKECVEEAENQLLQLAKRKYASTSEIASVLGVNQSTISRKMQRLKK
ncbi:Fis family transcriptional regulator [Domibacillus epiphyticus]|uniref:HTH-type transcriptional regulatory protein TyrR n=2 Tax=Domibacillus epiphyticus TaxID=1714355 RepID=A0A1V2A697_9BACI|nr:Fis family transcriptional regulator [Domibacillus epiphyticus]